jgi:hypothetical protein
MSIVLRKLKIYHLTDVGDTTTVNLHNWINKTFTKLLVIKRQNGDVYYIKNDIELIIQILECKQLHIEYYPIWRELGLKYKLSDNNIQDMIKYIMFKYYNVTNYTPMQLIDH